MLSQDATLQHLSQATRGPGLGLCVNTPASAVRAFYATSHVTAMTMYVFLFLQLYFQAHPKTMCAIALAPENNKIVPATPRVHKSVHRLLQGHSQGVYGRGGYFQLWGCHMSTCVGRAY